MQAQLLAGWTDGSNRVPRQRGFALRLLTYANLHFLLKLLMYSSAGVGSTVFFKRLGLMVSENQSELRDW